MGTTADAGTELVLKRLKEFCLLLETHAKLPSVAGLVLGGDIRGSWWAHPRAQEIFAVLQQVADHKDVLIAKLISGRVTFVHRKLWPDVLAVGMAREAWQTKGLSSAARSLLKMVDQSIELRSDRLAWPQKFKSEKPGHAVRELEKRLLIHTEEFHTESGAHAKQLATWPHWAQTVDGLGGVVKLADAKRTLEQKLSAINERFGSSALLPWIRTK